MVLEFTLFILFSKPTIICRQILFLTLLILGYCSKQVETEFWFFFYFIELIIYLHKSISCVSQIRYIISHLDGNHEMSVKISKNMLL